MWRKYTFCSSSDIISDTSLILKKAYFESSSRSTNFHTEKCCQCNRFAAFCSLDKGWIIFLINQSSCKSSSPGHQLIYLIISSQRSGNHRLVAKLPHAGKRYDSWIIWK
ncbi:hypothetical protein XENOCAPTIV_016416 [Xenoophorus captivus]|uniref:Uncharacterized protein n=1 Tax=Xenoophorus captivus TaxID=1517983 RepID=A0ABV0R0Q8_9TELE